MPTGFGTPFNLDDLSSNPLVIGGQINLNNIQFVKLVDIPGNGSFLDSQGHPILDNWLTTGSGGFDFRLPVGKGVGVVNAVPEPATICLIIVGALCSLFVFLERCESHEKQHCANVKLIVFAIVVSLSRMASAQYAVQVVSYNQGTNPAHRF